MSTVRGDTLPPASGPALSFTDTVDLALLHRRHPTEAFLTDAVRTGPHGFAAAAALPADHPHYAGHTGPSRDRDPMLLLECARQAETYAAHTMFGVARDDRFVLRNWSVEFPPCGLPPATGPTALSITATTGNHRLVGDRTAGLDYDLELRVAGRRVGRVRMAVAYLTDPAYRMIRARRHPDRLPSSDDLAATAGRPVEPAEVGRLRATDTLLLDVAAGPDTVTARVRVPVENPSLFDHAQDHVPAMVLMEAARQVAALATRHWGGAAPDLTRMVAASASFTSYAELAEPIAVTATPVPAAAALPAAAPSFVASPAVGPSSVVSPAVGPVGGASAPGGWAGGGSVDVLFRQGGVAVAAVRIDLAVPPARPSDEQGRRAPWDGQRS